MTQTITRMNPETLPDAGKIGYSQISIAEPGKLAFVSGQVAWRRDSGAVPGTLTEQMDVVAENVRHVLRELGAQPKDVVIARAYVVDLKPEDQDAILPAFHKLFDGVQPSFTVVGVTGLAAAELKIEMELVVRVS